MSTTDVRELELYNKHYTRGQEAEQLAEYGFAVFPAHYIKDGICSCGNPNCRNKAKHPLTGRGLLDATTNLNTIRGWWDRWPLANIAIATGETSGLLVLDVDGEKGRATLEANGWEIPNTPCVSTGREDGGIHYYFKHPGGKIKNSAGKLGEKVDIRADGGYVIVPGSIHATGNPYFWVVAPIKLPGDFTERADFADVPDWLLKALEDAENSSHALGEELPPVYEGGRDNFLIQRAGKYRRDGLSASLIAKHLRLDNQEFCIPPLDDADIERIAKSGFRYAPEFAVFIGNNDVARIASETWDVLGYSNDPIRLVSFGGLPSRVVEEGDRPQVELLTKERMTYEVNRAVVFKRQTTFLKGSGQRKEVETKDIQVHTPKEVIIDMLAHPIPPLPVLDRIIEAPAFGSDGQLHSEPGYRRESRTFYAPRKGFTVPEIPSKPTADDVERAKATILEPLQDFPFVGDADRANAIGLFLLPYVRGYIAGPTPLHLIEASQAGTGKDKLAGVITRTALGREPMTLTEGGEDDEWRKRITSTLLASPPIIQISNINRELASGSFAQALTGSHWTDRRLGASENISVPIQAVWIATANNPVVSGEISRRTVSIRLDAKQDRPWLRENFKIPNLESWVDHHRVELVWSALTLVQHWFATGAKAGKASLGSYEAWAKTVGGILESIGIPGFLVNRDSFYERADAETDGWRELVDLWWMVYQGNPVRAGDLLSLVDSEGILGIDISGSTPQGRGMSFGKLLAKKNENVFGPYRVSMANGSGNQKKFRIERLVPETEEEKTARETRYLQWVIEKDNREARNQSQGGSTARLDLTMGHQA